MEAEIRDILAAAVGDSESPADLFSTLLDRFGEVGGVELPIASRLTPARARRPRRVIILDTNVVSELMRASPAPAVASWVRRQKRGSLATTAVTIAEIRYGLARLPAGPTQDQVAADR